MSRSRKTRRFVGLLVSTITVLWLIFSVEWREVFSNMARIDLVMLLPVTIVFVVNFMLRAVRWRWLLSSKITTPLTVRFDSIVIGSFASFVLPFRAGEVVRPYMLSLKSQHSFTEGLISVVIERVFDLIAVLLCFVALTFWLNGYPDWVLHAAYAFSGIVVIAIILIITGLIVPRHLKALWLRSTRALPESIRESVAEVFDNISAGSALIHDGGAMLRVVILTALVWISFFLTYYSFLPLCGMELDLLMASTITIFVALIVAAPSAPGFIGVYQIGCIAAFKLFGVDLEEATAYALVTHAYQYLFMVCYGVFALSRAGLSLEELSRKNRS